MIMFKFLDVSFANDFSSFVTNSPVKKSVEFKINLDFHFLCKSGNFKIAEVMIDKSLELNIKLNPNQGGLFGRSKGGVECARRTFRAISASFFIQINPNTISNESWHLYLPVESLNIILSCIVLS